MIAESCHFKRSFAEAKVRLMPILFRFSNNLGQLLLAPLWVKTNFSH
jgi:hypothetical protein